MSNSNASANRVKGKKQSDRPENLSEKKRTTPRGPSSAKPRQLPPGYGYKSKATGERAPERDDKESQKPDLSKKDWVARRDATPKLRDEERVYFLVHSILSAWKLSAATDADANATGIIKVSRRKIEGALRDLKNTRFTKIPTIINDVLVYNEIWNEFGQWVYVEHDSPDWIFVRLPKNSTPVIRADIAVDRTGETPTAITTSSEVLLDNGGDDEDEIPENVEYDDVDESHAQEEEDEE